MKCGWGKIKRVCMNIGDDQNQGYVVVKWERGIVDLKNKKRNIVGP